MEILPLLIVLAQPGAPAGAAAEVMPERGLAGIPITSGRIAVDLETLNLAQDDPPSLDAIATARPAVDSDELEEPGEKDLNVIVVEGRIGPPPGDPIMQVNEAVFGVSMAVDTALVEPIADTYRDDFPVPVRKGLRNFFRNLTEPVNFLNFLLQGKPLSAIKTFGRFAINSTLGAGGLVDWAKNDNFDLPYQRNGFANTMGYYGVGPGPFLVLPLVGATTLRDLVGSGLDQLVLPTAIGKPFDTLWYAVPAYTVNSLEWRIAFDADIEQIKGSVVPYDAMKQFYLERRAREINALKGIHTPTMDELIEMDRQAEEESAKAAAAEEIPVQQDAEPEVIAPQAAPAGAPALAGGEPSAVDSGTQNGNDMSGLDAGGNYIPPSDGARLQPQESSISTLLANAGF